MSRGPRMDSAFYHALKEKIPSLDSAATCLTIPEGTSTTTMKKRILRVAAEISMPVAVRKVPRGLLFRRSTDEHRQWGSASKAHESHLEPHAAAHADVDSAVR